MSIEFKESQDNMIAEISRKLKEAVINLRKKVH